MMISVDYKYAEEDVNQGADMEMAQADGAGLLGDAGADGAPGVEAEAEGVMEPADSEDDQQMPPADGQGPLGDAGAADALEADDASEPDSLMDSDDSYLHQDSDSAADQETQSADGEDLLGAGGAVSSED